MSPPVLALTQGDPAGVGPEILLEVLAGWATRDPGRPDPGRSDSGRPDPWRPLLVAERCALERYRSIVPRAPWQRLHYLEGPPEEGRLRAAFADGGIPVVDPVGQDRPVSPGRPVAADAAGALAALDAGIELTRCGLADALVTAPINKATIARFAAPGFRGHTEHLAARCGLERYGRDYLMTFLTDDLRVALLSTHLPLIEALASVRCEAVLDALRCLQRHAPAEPDAPLKIAVAGLNPHAGERGLLGEEDEREIRPAVLAARREGIDAHGPESPDALFARARRGEFDWVIALYHDQGLIAVKTAAFGSATNQTLGLPFLRTSVDHGTAYEIAGTGRADATPLRRVIARTLRLWADERRWTPAAASAGGAQELSDYLSTHP